MLHCFLKGAFDDKVFVTFFTQLYWSKGYCCSVSSRGSIMFSNGPQYVYKQHLWRLLMISCHKAVSVFGTSTIGATGPKAIGTNQWTDKFLHSEIFKMFWIFLFSWRIGWKMNFNCKSILGCLTKSLSIFCGSPLSFPLFSPLSFPLSGQHKAGVLCCFLEPSGSPVAEYENH